jgi:hypothetical protein
MLENKLSRVGGLVVQAMWGAHVAQAMWWVAQVMWWVKPGNK